jgi:23S rRNA (pseudouridine1915-N3)-methyltransferase
MKVVFLQVGKTTVPAVQNLCEEYEKRLQRYISLENMVLPDLKKTKNLSAKQVKEQEAVAILKALKPGDTVILLDEKGKEYTSKGWAGRLQKLMNAGPHRLVFVVGGPFGFAPEVYAKAHYKLALSQMTFSHQIVRAFFMEQLYRAFAILNNDPYHHN